MKSLLNTVFVVAIWLQPFAATGADREGGDGMMDAATRWQRAALNREWAASTRIERAEELLTQAKDLQAKESTDLEERKRRFAQAGNLELAAAKLFGLACAGYDKAQANWNMLADLCRKAEDEEKEKRARQLGERAAASATAACGKAAHACELAANSFSKPNAGQAERAAGAGEQAAMWWERLAARK